MSLGMTERATASARMVGFAQRLRQRLDQAILPLVALVIFLALWEWAVTYFEVPKFIVPPPSDVAVAFTRGFLEAHYTWHLLVTLTEALGGFLIGSSFGIMIAVLVVTFPLAERIVYPYIVALQSLPKVAVAPLIIVWFGFGITSKLVIVALVSLFPVLVNMMAGLRALDQEKLDLLNALSASRWQMLRFLRFPNALPYLFAGLNTAIVFSVIGAIVGEFVGATEGLGVLILQANFALDIAGAFSLFIVLAMMGVSLHLILKTIQRHVVFWQIEQDRHTST